MQAVSVAPQSPAVGVLRPQRRRYVEVSSGVFCFVWLFVALLHFVCSIYYFAVADGYWVTTPNTVLAQMLHFHKLGIDMANYRTVAFTHGLIGIVHAALLVFMIVFSIYRRQFTFTSTQHTVIPDPDENKSIPPLVDSKPTNRTCSGGLSRCGRAVWRVLVALFGRKGILGVEGPYFDMQHLALELVETALQSYQAYRMSQHVPRPWLNALLVGLIVANCVCTPVLYHIFGSNALARRATCLAIDAVLDLVSSVVVPASLLLLYSVDYTGTSGGLKPSLWFNDMWFVNASNEFQLMLVTSWGDLAMRAVVAVGFVVSLESAKSLVRAQAVSARRVSFADVRAHPKEQPLASTSLSRRSVLGSAHGWLRSTARGRQVNRVAHAAFACWGVVILAIHLHAAALTHAPVCAMQLRPWLGSKPACALMLIDCERYNLTHASQEEIREQYMISDLNRVARLTIRHCPDLRIPSPLQLMRVVTAIKLYNSTIVDWPREAALTSSHHPALTVISLVRVVFPDGQLPAGLMDTDFPKRATSIFVCNSNLETLPLELATRWPQYAYLLFEESHFTTFPSVLMALNPIQISFAENHFTQFPFEALRIPSLVFLNMGGNRGISLLVPPDDAVASKSLAVVNLVNTNVSVLPDSFDAILRPTVTPTAPQVYPTFAASGTPLCDNTAKVIAGELLAYPDLDSIPAARRSFFMNFTHATRHRSGRCRSASPCR